MLNKCVNFLGLSGYFRKFMCNYAKIVEPLTRLVRKSVKWEWRVEQKKSFEIIKEMLSSKPILAVYDPELPTDLHTDASSIGVAGVLLQEHKDGNKRVVGYFISKQTTPEQRMYNSYELERLAVMLSLQYFRVYLLGRQFKVVSDFNALNTAFTKRDLVLRVGRWWLMVQDYQFDIEYRPGRKMNHADALSRNPIEEVASVDLTEADWIVAAQMHDKHIWKVKNILETNVRNKDTIF